MQQINPPSQRWRGGSDACSPHRNLMTAWHLAWPGQLFNATFSEPDPQATAHAVLALSLLRPGLGRRCAAAAGAAWLTTLQQVNGGWEYPAGQETPLVNGEIALSVALAPEPPKHCPVVIASSNAADDDTAALHLSRSKATRPRARQPL